MSALDKQVGGSHYKDLVIQPSEYSERNGLSALEGNVVKYISRWKKKGGAKDLLKAIHCIEMIMEMHCPDETVHSAHFFDTERNLPFPDLPSIAWEEKGLKADDLIHGTYKQDGYEGNFRYFPASKVDWDRVSQWERAK
jgi:hypothetical protein